MNREPSSPTTIATGPRPVATLRAPTSNADRNPMHALFRSKHSHVPRSPSAAATLLEVAGMRLSPPRELTKISRSMASGSSFAMSSAAWTARAPSAAAVSPFSANQRATMPVFASIAATSPCSPRRATSSAVGTARPAGTEPVPAIRTGIEPFTGPSARASRGPCKRRRPSAVGGPAALLPPAPPLATTRRSRRSRPCSASM